jgi:hypothetical protein
MGVEKIFSFGSWDTDHPSDRHPGERIDAQFDAHANAIRALERRIDALVRADGKLHDNVLPFTSPVLLSGGNAATLSAAAPEDWAEVSMEWAEHMPDTIPPNILATNAITGDHWSSRWWANQAARLAARGTVTLIKLKHFPFDGVATTFPLLDETSAPIVPATNVSQLTISVEGVIQEPGVDFTLALAGASVTFTTPPPADARNFATYALQGQTSAATIATAAVSFPTRTLAAAALLPLETQAIATAGYLNPGDGGDALYYRAGGITPGGFQSADGAWWALEQGNVNVRLFGAVGNGASDDAAAFQVAVNSVASGAGVEVNVPVGRYLLNSDVTANGRIVAWDIAPGTVFTGTGKLVPQSVGFYAAFDNVARMEIYQQRGSPSAPWNNLNPMVALVQHTSSAGIAAGIPQAPLSVTNYKYDTAASGRATAVFSEAIDPTGGASTFVEGLRAHGIRTSAAAAGGSAYGVIALAQAADNAPAYVIGTEVEVSWSGASAVDAPATPVFSTARFVANFMATCRTGVKADALFLGNPFNTVPARAGVLLPPGSVDHTAFSSKAATQYGLDLGQGTQALASIRLPNDGQIASVNGAGNGNLNLLYADATNQMVIGTNALRVTTPVSLKVHSATAIPAGGAAGAGIMVSSAVSFGVFFGSGVPTLAAAKGSLYLRSDGSSNVTRMYVNTDGGATWTAVNTVA